MATAPGTTGPALIRTNRAETTVGAAEEGCVEGGVSSEGSVPCPASGRPVAPGATVTAGAPLKK